MRSVGRPSGIAVVALAAVFVALGAAAGSLYWDRVAWKGEQAARRELPSVAAAEVPKVFGYDYQTVERSLTEAYPYFTTRYRPQFEERATSEIIPQARERRLVNRVDVTGIGVLTARRTTGSVLVYMNRTFTDKSTKEFYDASRLRIDFRKVDSRWLIDNMVPI